jgi:hypothetical protein
MEVKNLFVFAAGDAAAQVHYTDTMDRDFDVDRVKTFLASEKLVPLCKTAEHGTLRVWGSTRGKQNEKTWSKMHPGDFVVSSRNGFYEHIGRVVSTIHNPKMAFELWGVDKDGRPWEFVYFLTDVTKISVPNQIMNVLLGYKDHYSLRGFGRVASEAVSLITKKYGSLENFASYLISRTWIELATTRISTASAETATIREEEIEDYICKNLDFLEPGLELIQRQKILGAAGKCDIICQAKNGDIVICEVKRGKLKLEHVAQLMSYVGYTRKHIAQKTQRVRGILVTVGKNRNAEYALHESKNVHWISFDLDLLLKNKS